MKQPQDDHSSNERNETNNNHSYNTVQYVASIDERNQPTIRYTTHPIVPFQSAMYYHSIE
eukprot:scaffold56706_cov54-Attheya_sp.AAC.1